LLIHIKESFLFSTQKKAMFERLANWLSGHMIPCLFKQVFGIDCPTCGMQRAFVELIKGNLYQSLSYHWALLPTITLALFLAIHLRYKLSFGTLVIKILFTVDIVAIALNYIFN